MTFDRYAEYYDLLYRDKDYGAEAAFVDNLIQRYAKGACSLLELGCGTGLHACLLSHRGYNVYGIDQSEQMVRRAEARKAAMPTEVAKRVAFEHGDARSVRLGRRFDCVVSLFHVASYHTSNADLERLFATARAHLQDGGLFIFDCWYGPAVLKERPSVRVKRLEDDRVRVLRIAEPVMYPNECVVNVAYLVLVEDRNTGAVEQLSEVHRMRYLFLPEIEGLLSVMGMQMVHSCEWLTGGPLGEDSWSACFLARA
jgi:SAM-dependent methyltransferase